MGNLFPEKVGNIKPVLTVLILLHYSHAQNLLAAKRTLSLLAVSVVLQVQVNRIQDFRGGSEYFVHSVVLLVILGNDLLLTQDIQEKIRFGRYDFSQGSAAFPESF